MFRQLTAADQGALLAAASGSMPARHVQPRDAAGTFAAGARGGGELWIDMELDSGSEDEAGSGGGGRGGGSSQQQQRSSSPPGGGLI